MNKGFTLIELLVVVLIIGILAAVALPQYTKAVEKSRTAEAMQVLGDLATAEQIHYMAQNAFTTELDQMDLTFPGVSEGKIVTNSYEISVSKNDDKFVAIAERKGGAYDGKGLAIQVEKDGKIERGFKTDDAAFNGLAPQWQSDKTKVIAAAS